MSWYTNASDIWVEARDRVVGGISNASPDPVPLPANIPVTAHPGTPAGLSPIVMIFIGFALFFIFKKLIK